jgi:hypothetical protein
MYARAPHEFHANHYRYYNKCPLSAPSEALFSMLLSTSHVTHIHSIYNILHTLDSRQTPCLRKTCLFNAVRMVYFTYSRCVPAELISIEIVSESIQEELAWL